MSSWPITSCGNLRKLSFQPYNFKIQGVVKLQLGTTTSSSDTYDDQYFSFSISSLAQVPLSSLPAHQVMPLLPLVVNVLLVLEMGFLLGWCRGSMVGAGRGECCHKAPQQVMQAGRLGHTSQQPVQCLKKECIQVCVKYRKVSSLQNQNCKCKWLDTMNDEQIVRLIIEGFETRYGFLFK